jgi:hypothetical protein
MREEDSEGIKEDEDEEEEARRLSRGTPPLLAARDHKLDAVMMNAKIFFGEMD